jgi:hypothetical protein
VAVGIQTTWRLIDYILNNTVIIILTDIGVCLPRADGGRV